MCKAYSYLIVFCQIHGEINSEKLSPPLLRNMKKISR